MQQTQQEQYEKAIEQLKVRLFDTQEQARALDTTLSQYAGAVAQMLGLTEPESQDLNIHLQRIKQLTTVETVVEGELVAE